MASSSSSTFPLHTSSPCKKSVFISARYVFSAIILALNLSNIQTCGVNETFYHDQTFCHDRPIEGSGISFSTIKAIEQSEIAVVIFSKEYASSGQCLDELVKIMDCKNKKGQKVITVFNQVDPLDVRYLTGSFGEQFSKLGERFKDNVEKLQTWRNALMEAADLPGFVSDTMRSESELVEQIVGAILKILNANKIPRDVYNKDMVVADVFIPPPIPPSLQNDFPKINYDTYLSFSAEDTRKNFISYLYSTLIQNQIKTCIGGRNVIRGDEISPSVVNTIEGSKVAVIILSKGYASSATCLNELVKIIECKNKYGQLIVIPIFYQVDPSEVRNQTQNFGEEFLKLEERFKEDVEKLQKWRSALREASNLPGFVSHAIRSEPLLVERVVEYILRRLNDNLDKDLVGVESYLKDIEPLLDNRSTGVASLGIWGISGIGKSTIVKVIFNKISSRFDGAFFIQNSREESEKIVDLLNLQHNLLSMLFEDGNLNIGVPSIGIDSRERHRYKKILVVFDDVTCLQEVESLMTILDRFMPASLLIITNTNEKFLQDCGVKKTYEMKKLVDVDALKLFSWHAFGQDHPDVGYEELSRKAMQYTQSIPLALKVVGLFLSGRSKEEWESTINKLEGIPRTGVQKVLRVIYDGLDDKEQNIFLKIACSLVGEDRDCAIKLLDPTNGTFAEEGINVLIDKRLITISDNNKIVMHNLLQEMGREIAWNNLGKHSRLRHLEDTTIDFEKMLVTTSFILEIFSSVFEQLSSVHKPHYALVSMSLSFAAVLLCIVDLIYKGRKEQVIWKWRRSTLFPWFYYPSETHDKRFGTFQDIVGLLCSLCQCILTSISFSFVHRHAENPIKVSAWPIIFTAGVWCYKLFEK